jgi:hypothetical protein
VWTPDRGIFNDSGVSVDLGDVSFDSLPNRGDVIKPASYTASKSNGITDNALPSGI